LPRLIRLNEMAYLHSVAPHSDIALLAKLDHLLRQQPLVRFLLRIGTTVMRAETLCRPLRRGSAGILYIRMRRAQPALFPYSIYSVRREKALVHSGWKSRPGTGSLPPGSNPSSSGSNEAVEALGIGPNRLSLPSPEFPMITHRYGHRRDNGS
jgi:hypothetical protein